MFKVFTIYGHGGRDHLNKISVPSPMEAPHEIWLQSAQWFQKRRGLKMLTHTYIHTDDRGLSYKLTTEPKGSGELIKPRGRGRLEKRMPELVTVGLYSHDGEWLTIS